MWTLNDDEVISQYRMVTLNDNEVTFEVISLNQRFNSLTTKSTIKIVIITTLSTSNSSSRESGGHSTSCGGGDSHCNSCNTIIGHPKPAALNIEKVK